MCSLLFVQFWGVFGDVLTCLSNGLQSITRLKFREQIANNYERTSIFTQSSFLIVLSSNSARFSRMPGSESTHLDLEKLLLLSDLMENVKVH